MTERYEKLERNGKVAILYSPGFGAGWSTWNSDHKGLVFDREIVEAVLAGDKNKAIEIAKAKYDDPFTDGACNLKVMWLPKGAQFRIDEYDGSESVHIFDGHEYLVA